MTISKGDQIPDATLFSAQGEAGNTINLREKAAGRKLLIFGVPGAFTGTCSNEHVPDFLANYEAIQSRGVDEVICLAVNDPFVLSAWADATGLKNSGITLLGDCDGSFVRAAGLAFDAPDLGLKDRAKRFIMLVDDGIVEVLKVESNPGECRLTRGSEALDWL